MAAKTLQDLFAENKADITHCAHVAVDVQADFCRFSWPVAKHIGEDVAPAFNELNVPTYWVYYEDGGIGPGKAFGGLLHARPAKGDFIVPKTEPSAFAGSPIDDHLQQHQKRILFVGGFYCDACVAATVYDALSKDYDVVLMNDCVDNEGAALAHLMEMERKGVVFARSEEVISFLERQKGMAPA